MKIKIFNSISIVFLSSIFFSCGEYILNDKDIFKEKVKPYTYYEPNYQIVTINNGFLTRIQKVISNGDSTKCEVISSREMIVTKINFDGKIVWQKKDEGNANFPTNYTEGDNGNIYDCGGNFGTTVTTFDSTLKITSQLDLKTSQYFKNGERLLGLKYIKENLVLGYGQTKVVQKNKKEYTTKIFICVIDTKLGLQKLEIDDNEIPSNIMMTYDIDNSKNIYGVAIINDYNTQKTLLKLQRFDVNLKKVKEIELPLKWPQNLQNNNLSLKNGEINILYNLAGIKYINVNKNFEVNNSSFGPSFALNPAFLKSKGSEIYYSEGNGTNFTRIKKIETQPNGFISKTILETEYNLINTQIIDLNGYKKIYDFTNIGNYNKPNISLLSLNAESNLFPKPVFESQYSRYCTRGLF
jgi:hypothetical protein